MEVGYKSIFVKQYSYGNSFALEEDLEKKRYKVKFINKWSVSVVISILFVIIAMLVTIFVMAKFPKKMSFRTNKYVKRKPNTKLFHADEFISCTQNKDGKCVNWEELKQDYSEKLKAGLKLKNLEVYDSEGLFCKGGVLDKYCFQNKVLKGITQKELEAIAETLVDAKIKLDLEFEIPTLQKFKDFVSAFEREYKDLDQYKSRYGAFRDNRIFIETHNSDPDRLYSMGYSASSDIIFEENAIAVNPAKGRHYLDDDDELLTTAGQKLPKSKYPGVIFDWRDKGVINPIRNQGGCGSCWAFATSDTIAAMKAIRGGPLKVYSTQQLMDCIDPMFTCKKGGSSFSALGYISKFRYCTEEEYPYMERDFGCRQPNICKDWAGVRKFYDLKNMDLEKHLETTGPFIFGIYASREFMFYKEGIFDGDCSKHPDHGVVVVGHGYDKEKDAYYWIVRNSWDTTWGEDGYFRILNAYETRDKMEGYYCKMGPRSTGIEMY